MWAAHCSCSNVTGTDDPGRVVSCSWRSDHYSTAVDPVSSSVLPKRSLVETVTGRARIRSRDRSGEQSSSRRRPLEYVAGPAGHPLGLGAATQHPDSGIRSSPDVGRGLHRGVGSTVAGSGGEHGGAGSSATLRSAAPRSLRGADRGARRGAGGAANCGQPR